MSAAAWGAIGAVIGPVIVFITFMLSRGQASKVAEADVTLRTLEGALSTTDTMRLLLEPLEKEIQELRTEVGQLRMHIVALQAQIRALGHDPIDPDNLPPIGRIK